MKASRGGPWGLYREAMELMWQTELDVLKPLGLNDEISLTSYLKMKSPDVF